MKEIDRSKTYRDPTADSALNRDSRFDSLPNYLESRNRITRLLDFGQAHEAKKQRKLDRKMKGGV